MNNINDVQRSKREPKRAPVALGANEVLPLLAAVLNKLNALGVRCSAYADEAKRALVIEIEGATTEMTEEGKTRFVMRPPAGEG
ncbi:MAG: hypothetical protein RMN52_02345 [Anaerolineae bacterium]|nr:hypothetical protein [Candidatus Roseilinea sp.]MDW8448821.1 hypothetical protein [Anaerolineae bacterium]